MTVDNSLLSSWPLPFKSIKTKAFERGPLTAVPPEVNLGVLAEVNLGVLGVFVVSVSPQPVKPSAIKLKTTVEALEFSFPLLRAFNTLDAISYERRLKLVLYLDIDCSFEI